MKKIIFALILMVSLAIFVSAKMTPHPPDEQDYDVEVYMEKGWNMILLLDLDMDERTFLTDSDIKKDNIIAMYMYIPQDNKYYEAYPNSDELIDSLNSLPQDAQAFLNIASAWVYSDKSGYLRYKRTDVPKYHQVKLADGWNFFTLTPGLKTKKLSQFKGDCEISKIAHWQHQEWNVIDPQSLLESSHSDAPSSWDDVILADSDSDIGRGILIKVTNSCQFGDSGSSSTISPPEIPT